MAVVMSLIYVATQIRTQNKAARLSAMHEISVGFRESIAIFTEGELAEIFIRGNSDFDSLSDAETLRLLAAFAGVLRVWEEAFIRYEEGQLDTRSWESMLGYYRTLFGAPSLRRVWSLRKAQFDDKFRKYVDELETAEYKIR